MSSLREACGVFGYYSNSQKSVADKIYYGLTSLQHRGQEAAGIAVCDTYGDKENVSFHKDLGLVSEVFDTNRLNALKGNIGIGHVRYSTTGDSNVENAQPVVFRYLKGTLALVHNGNIVNCDSIKEELFNDGGVFRATTDTEAVACLIAKMRAKTGSIEEAVKIAASRLEGGYALLIMSPRKIVAVRDPWGLKPLCMGKCGDDYVFASEDCALTAIGATFVRDILPGEIVSVSKKKGIVTDMLPRTAKVAHCIFEYIYFARLDSKIDGVSVFKSRFEGGRALAKAYPVEADFVTGVPESGITAARGFAAESGIPFEIAFHKNSYIGRSFIKPTQEEREHAVQLKLSVLKDVVCGKRIVLTDDSIVRGTTIKNLITMLKEAGAKEVHVRISSPPFLYPCFYGTDVPDNSQLIANHNSTEEIRKMIGADSLGYMKLEDLEKLAGNLNTCKACFDGKYPTDINRG